MDPRTFWNNYQEETQDTAVYPGQMSITGFSYVGLKLAGETGEVLEHLGKSIRDDSGELTDSRRLLLSKEIGDVLWYVARAARELGMKLGIVVEMGPDDLTAMEIPGRGTPTARTCIGFGLSKQVGYVSERLLRLLTEQAGSYLSADKDFFARRLACVFNWLNQLAVECGLDLQEIASENLDKLARRKANGTLHGSGSDR